MTDDLDRRSALFALKLRVLVTGRWPDAIERARPGSFPGGATLVDEIGGRAWILLDEDADRRLGAGAALAQRAGLRELHLIVDSAAQAGILARRASLLRVPPSVWLAVERDLLPVAAAPPATDPAPSPEAELYRPVLLAAGLEPVVEAGNLLGEFRGLEVARAVTDAEGGTHIETGVGRFDREAGAMMFAELGETDALARVVAYVTPFRVAGAERHPLNQLVLERWLRTVVVADPAMVGAATLRSVGSAIPRRNLKETGVATAVGTDLEGRPLVVTCSTGVHLDLVPSAADDRLTHAPDARLVLVVPARDAVAVTTELASALADPAEVISVGDDWQRHTPDAS